MRPSLSARRSSVRSHATRSMRLSMDESLTLMVSTPGRARSSRYFSSMRAASASPSTSSPRWFDVDAQALPPALGQEVVESRAIRWSEIGLGVLVDAAANGARGELRDARTERAQRAQLELVPRRQRLRNAERGDQPLDLLEQALAARAPVRAIGERRNERLSDWIVEQTPPHVRRARARSSPRRPRSLRVSGVRAGRRA